MQFVILLMAMGIFMHDQFVHRTGGPWPVGGSWSLVAAILLPKLLAVGAYALICRRALGRLGTSRGRAGLRRVEWAGSVLRSLAIGLYIGDLYLGGLRWIRGHTGDLILVSDALFMAPTLLLLAAGWWFYYPIDRRLRNAALIARLDDNLPVYPIWTRRQYMLAQWRHQMVLYLTPLLLIMGWLELVERHVPTTPLFGGLDLHLAATGAGLLAVMVVTPVIVRHIWDTLPLPKGDLRNHLMGLCRDYRVGVREVLLWRTFGGLINGAVMGVIPQTRYILLTDALLDTLPARQVEAVLAHELAHVRKHHLFWLFFVSLSVMSSMMLVIMIVLDFAVSAAYAAGLAQHLPADVWDQLARADSRAQIAAIINVLCWFPVFGWVSRRFERQADTFAVRHFTERARPSGDEEELRIDAAAAALMTDTLQAVADLNHLPDRRSRWWHALDIWRPDYMHGSIAWRKQYLNAQVGRPVDRLPIDRLVFGIQAAAVAAAVLSIAAWTWFHAKGWA